ncbi:MAG: zinc ribbon domain-containing protein [Chloroflexi bacterium]|nr:zinc ribbon domain-containing protein [Chloroflexota bacterium]MCI0575747.1 zinc ribbon domain-containing protein [Chloroflexota bacterium]MCI0729813.1 zinc ribbon domain-containing protein [Chloroflexota bacterium]
MLCSECATPNPAQARFCLNCGQSLTAGLVCSLCHTLLPVQARFCFHCGHMVVGAAAPAERHCPACGVVVAPGQVQCHHCGIMLIQVSIAPAQPQPAPSISPAPQPTPPPTPSPPSSDHLVTGVGRANSSPPHPLTPSRPLSEMLPSLKKYLPEHLFEPLERRPTERQLTEVGRHLVVLLRTAKTYLPRPVVLNPQPGSQPAGGMVQGSFLFVDVSGFTPLSERLSRFGQDGAERVTSIINSLFFDLVSILLNHGGSLLKFGGDALLGVFEADASGDMSGGALQAAQAALAMQGIMPKFSAIEAAGQTMALRIKCGISSGPFFAAHIGTPQDMAYVTTGFTVNQAEQAEGQAEPGEVAITRSTYDLIKDQVEVEQRAEGFYRLLSAAGEMDPAARKGKVVPLDDDPPGDGPEQLTYLVDRLDRLTPYLAADLLPRMVTNRTMCRWLPTTGR